MLPITVCSLLFANLFLFTDGKVTFISGNASPSCKYSRPALECTTANLEIPTNFDATKIRSETQTITLDCPNSNTDNYCNIIKKNAPPFPPLQQLREVNLYGFKADDGGRVPINLLLRNVKEHIQQVFIRNSRIGKLDSEYLKGFSGLMKLQLEDNDIAEVAANSFQSLTTKSPVLQVIDLSRNRISSLDWMVLQPVADSLVELHLEDQKPGLQTLFRNASTNSTKFVLKKLSTLEMRNNKLSTIPKDVLETMTTFPDDLTMFTFGENSFCPSDPDCSCCELKDFFSWVGTIRKTVSEKQEVILSYNCGSADRARGNLLIVKKTGYRLSAGQGNVKLLDKLSNNTQC